MQYTVTIDTEHRVGRFTVENPPGKVAWYSAYKYFSKEDRRDYTIEVMFETGVSIKIPWFDTQAELLKESESSWFIFCLEDYEDSENV